MILDTPTFVCDNCEKQFNKDQGHTQCYLVIPSDDDNGITFVGGYNLDEYKDYIYDMNPEDVVVTCTNRECVAYATLKVIESEGIIDTMLATKASKTRK